MNDQRLPSVLREETSWRRGRATRRPLASTDLAGRRAEMIDRGDELPAGEIVVTPSRSIQHPSWKDLL